MKIKWLVILLIIYLLIMAVIIFSGRQNNDTSQPETKPRDSAAAQAIEQTAPIITAPLQNGITIISKPAPKVKETPLPVEPAVSFSAKEISSDLPPSEENKVYGGITKDEGKYPNTKETREMNSAGIVMY